MTAEEFQTRTGRRPEHDDLERVNCPKAGKFGHLHCGWCDSHDTPRFQCGCLEILSRNGFRSQLEWVSRGHDAE